MNRTAWKACLLALPASLFAGTIPLTDGVDIVTTNGSSLQIGACASGNCTISGQATITGFKLNWSFVSPSSMTDSGIAPNYTIIGGTGSFTLTDTANLGGGDTLNGTISLASLTEFSSGGTNNNMNINGTLTVLPGGFLPGGLLTSTFQTLLAQGGITTPVPPGGESAALAISVVNCVKGGTPSACVIQLEPTGTVASVAITSSAAAVPEPATMALFGAGLAGLFIRRRFTR